MIRGGAIDDVEYIFGAHVRPFEEAENGQASPAIHYASSCRMVIAFHGKPAHGARPHLGINALDAAAQAVNAVNAIHLKPTDNYSVKATRFLCDSGVTNAIPAKAVVTWDFVHNIIKRWMSFVLSFYQLLKGQLLLSVRLLRFWIPSVFLRLS